MSDHLRHRDRMLSLKYSTIESCFSVPMLNLTMPNLPFAIAFAVTALHWGPSAVGLMATLPHLCNFVQPLLTRCFQGRWSLYRIIVWSFVGSGVPWLFTAFMVGSPRASHWIFAAILIVATLANSASSVAWSAAIAELVPARIGGKFFGRRNLLFGFWTLLTLIIAGKLVDQGENSMQVFAAIFTAAGLARLIGIFFLTRMKFPASVMERQPETAAWKDFLLPLQTPNYGRLILFIGLWGMLLNMSLPFYTVFLIDEASFRVGDVAALTTLASLGGLMTLKGWAFLVDRYGNKPVLAVCAIAWSLAAWVSWLCAGPRFTTHLYATYLVVGATTAGFQLCQFNLMIRLVPVTTRAPFIAVFLSLTSLMTAAGPLLGSAILRVLPDELGALFGHALRDYHWLFVGSLTGCLVSVLALRRVKEDAAQPVEAVWKTMRTMPVFNPLLGLSTAVGLIFSPRGMTGLTRQSLRSLRRQARVLTEVGEELVSGGQEILRKPRDREK